MTQMIQEGVQGQSKEDRGHWATLANSRLNNKCRRRLPIQIEVVKIVFIELLNGLDKIGRDTLLFQNCKQIVMAQGWEGRLQIYQKQHALRIREEHFLTFKIYNKQQTTRIYFYVKL